MCIHLFSLLELSHPPLSGFKIPEGYGGTLFIVYCVMLNSIWSVGNSFPLGGKVFSRRYDREGRKKAQ